MTGRTVLVTGANGFLGNAVAKAFSLEGWTTYGLLRSQKAIPDLLKHEITPVIGTTSNLDFLETLPAINIVVSTTGNTGDTSQYNEIVSMLKVISEKTRHQHGKKLLVILTSGCKDYGTTKRHGEAGLAPHTEKDPLRPPKLVVDRFRTSLLIFDHSDEFDAVVTRPTTMYGYSGSYYAPFFSLSEQAKAAGHSTLEFAASPDSILHGTHVDDVAAAYVRLASTQREVVAGQTYNISGKHYETLKEIVAVLEQSYGLRVTYKDPVGEDKIDIVDYLVNFSQWVGSDKLRKDTGWWDKKNSFSKGFEVYRHAYEQAARDGAEGVTRIADLVKYSRLSKEEQARWKGG